MPTPFSCNPSRTDKAQSLLEAHLQDPQDAWSKRVASPNFNVSTTNVPKNSLNFLTRKKIEHQFVPPHDHRRNSAERCVRTAKNHLIAGWCSAPMMRFPMYLWAKTIKQAELTLNLLRGSRMNPKLSAWEQIEGRCDCNATPIAPPGTKCLVHVKNEQKGTWDPHALEAWYLGPAWNSYRCCDVCVPSTCGVRITNTLTWLPTKYTMPVATPADLIRAAAEDMKDALKSTEKNTFISNLPQTKTDLLKELTEVLTNIAKTANPSRSEPPITEPVIPSDRRSPIHTRHERHEPRHRVRLQEPHSSQSPATPDLRGCSRMRQLRGWFPPTPQLRGWSPTPTRLLRGW